MHIWSLSLDLFPEKREKEMRIALGLPAGISDGPGAACWDLPTPWVWKQKQLALSLFLFPAFSKMHQGTKGPKGTKKKEAGPLK
jgi:hypothetical protein